MSDYDWILGIGMPVMIALIYFFLDENNSGLVIFSFLSIGLGIMVMAGLVEFWVLLLSIISTILIIFITRKKGGVVVV